MTDKPTTTAEEIQEMARLQFTREEVAIIVGRPLDKWKGPERLAYQRGQLKAEAEIRQAMLKLATQGSSSAQKDFLTLIDRRRIRDEQGGGQ